MHIPCHRDIDWSYERTYQLITMNGIAAKPESHQGFTENPLIPVDYVTVSGRHDETIRTSLMWI